MRKEDILRRGKGSMIERSSEGKRILEGGRSWKGARSIEWERCLDDWEGTLGLVEVGRREEVEERGWVGGWGREIHAVYRRRERGRKRGLITGKRFAKINNYLIIIEKSEIIILILTLILKLKLIIIALFYTYTYTCINYKRISDTNTNANTKTYAESYTDTDNSNTNTHTNKKTNSSFKTKSNT